MRLVYKTGSIFRLPANKYQGDPVEVGDKVTLADGEQVTVDYFREPHKPSSEGKVTVAYADGSSREYYVSVIGAAWVDREDRPRVDNGTDELHRELSGN